MSDLYSVKSGKLKLKGEKSETKHKKKKKEKKRKHDKEAEEESKKQKTTEAADTARWRLWLFVVKCLHNTSRRCVNLLRSISR